MQRHGTDETPGNPQVIVYQRTSVRKIQLRQTSNTAFSDSIQFAKPHGFADAEILVFIEEIGSGTLAFTTGQEIEQFRFQCQGGAEYIATHIHHVMRARRRARGQEKRQ